MNTYYEQSKQEYIEDYIAKHEKMIENMKKLTNDTVSKYGNEIGQLEQLLISNDFEIVGFGNMACCYDQKTFDAKCYYKVKHKDHALVFNITCAISKKYNRPYFYIGSIDRKLNLQLRQKLYEDLVIECANKPSRLHLTSDNFLEFNDEFFNLITALSQVNDVDSFNNFTKVNALVNSNIENIKTLKKL